ncbi:aminotransferase class III-fold pyridoxal phosphate-dependent enzyme [Burkholderia oklahomensis]|uniref:aspartate aminotransferase family protein n=1 Tax=Burkholderia oklahomensis TaxID=342113 RepID=UPI00264BF40D|nr:aminotransferase class III-fold pyridoxal phosphate-dependent enzyme [Burkholderia oklahomensis]MDN7673560.1 aminotransferase class III-fold pyridoxal phosphate-dependent enzyme [Burkholderia oklahomensis]
MKREINETRVGNVLSGWNHLAGIGPIQISNARGSRIQTCSGEWRDDYIMGWGSCFLGHDSPVIRESVTRAMSCGFLQQYETERHQLLSERFCAAVPCAEKLRLVNSGLEATMYATRIARAVTGKRLILKFEGHFHGLNDTLTWNIDSSPRSGAMLENGELERVAGTVGIPDELGQLTVPLPWNDLNAARNAFERYSRDVAGVILEPIALNIGCIKPDDGFLQDLRELTTKHEALLIFDEVLTGFRSNLGGAQQELGVIPDIATYGKAFGCGMPIAGIAGKAEYMDVIAPRGPVQISGTNTGRYLSVSAALSVLEYLADGSVYRYVADLESRLKNGLREVFDRHGIPCHIDGYGGRIGVHIGASERPRTMRDIERTYPVAFAHELFRLLSTEYRLYGFLMPLSYCPEPVTLSAAHTLQMIDDACERLDRALDRLEYHAN